MVSFPDPTNPSVDRFQYRTWGGGSGDSNCVCVCSCRNLCRANYCTHDSISGCLAQAMSLRSLWILSICCHCVPVSLLHKNLKTRWLQWSTLASFPGLHAQLLSLAVWKRGKAWTDFITWCVPLLMSRTVASHDQSSSNRPRRTNWTEITNWIQGKKSEGERTNPNVSRLNMTSAMACIMW